jgi:hypothetical protein
MPPRPGVTTLWPGARNVEFEGDAASNLHGVTSVAVNED